MLKNALLKAYNMNQKQLAAHFKISVQAIRQWPELIPLATAVWIANRRDCKIDFNVKLYKKTIKKPGDK